MSEIPACGPSRSVRPCWLFAYSLAFGFVSHTAFAQVDSSGTAPQTSSQLKEITVTAERRTQNLQKVAASVAVVSGAEIEAQGKITTAQILEDVPNVSVGANPEGDNPNGNITIRGIETSPTTGGLESPQTTATYVDDVYNGIGGDFDISRVEVLYGPQGTLYGRSATGGVVAFHTNDPQLGKFGGTIMGEYGSYDLRQAIVAVNIPVLPQIAVRVAAREFDQHGFFGNSVGGSQRTQEARVKVLYQPMSNFSIIGAWTINEQHNNSGGFSAGFSGPNTIDNTFSYATPISGEARYHQYSGTAKYDFGYGTATYIGAFHDYDSTSASTAAHQNTVVLNPTLNPLYQVHTEELRIASDPGSPLTWLVGANFYSNQLKNIQGQYQLEAFIPNTTILDTTPGVTDAPVRISDLALRIFDYGLFTEETYPILPNLRITGGARVDESKVDEFVSKDANLNQDAYGNLLSPPSYLFGAFDSTKIFRNFTYKARVEYDLAPENMVYASVSTGFLPGQQQLTIIQNPGQPQQFVTLPYTQEILHSYEIGSKNRFLQNTLQINGDVYYEHYSGYQVTVQTNPNGPPGGSGSLVAIPLDIYGAELSAQWLFTPNDRFSFSGGLTDAQIPGDPIIPGTTDPVGEFLQRRLSNTIPSQFTVAYNHTITFADGSSLQPRAQGRFYGAYNTTDLAYYDTPNQEPYIHQGAILIGDVDLQWTSANGKYSVDGYVRNISNAIYKTNVTASSRGLDEINVTPSDPRIAGIVVTAKF